MMIFKNLFLILTFILFSSHLVAQDQEKQAQVHSKLQKELIQEHYQQMKALEKKHGFVELKKQMIEELSKKPDQFLTKDEYYQQLALLQVMAKKKPHEVSQAVQLLEQTYEDYLENMLNSGGGYLDTSEEAELKSQKFLFSLFLFPTWETCSHKKDFNQRKECLNTNIYQFINKTLDHNKVLSILKNEGIVPKVLKENVKFDIRVKFVISASGKIINVKGLGSNEEINKLYQNVFYRMPLLVPAKKDGQAIKFHYILTVRVVYESEN